MSKLATALAISVTTLALVCTASLAQSPRSTSPPSTTAAPTRYDPIVALQAENQELTARVSRLEAQVAQMDSALKGMQQSTGSAGRYKGYGHAITTKLNWNSIPNDALIEYWARN
jgi:hypothetical protein